MRLIDADAILKRAGESFKNAGLHSEDYKKFKKWLRTAPTIDVVEVVRCKDCDRKLGSTECPCCAKEYHINEETFYCAWGKRKDGDDE